AAVRVGEHQQRPTVGVGGVAGFELAGQYVDGARRALRPGGGGVVAAVHVGGSAGESTAAQLVVLEPVEVGVQAARCPAFTQVDEGFHGGSNVATASAATAELKVTLLFVLVRHKGLTCRRICRD